MAPDVLIKYEQMLSDRSDQFEKSLEAQSNRTEGFLTDRSDKFQNFVEEQAKTHQEHLESFHNWTFAVIGLVATAALTIFGALITWYSARDREMTKRELTTKFSDEIAKLVREKGDAFQQDLNVQEIRIVDIYERVKKATPSSKT